MSLLNRIYRTSLALSTDLYQLTMAQAYWRSGMAERRSVFNLYFRKSPFNGGFTVACGLQLAIDFLQRFRFDEEDLSYLSTLTGHDGERLFEESFLHYLGELDFSCDVHGVPEGTVVFPLEPLIRVEGPILQAQIMETPLLTLLNYQTLVATKAARMTLATGGEPVLEFGLRRAQGIDGGLGASRAAFVGGVAASSNVLAGRIYGIPVRGTHAHSWVMSFDDELEAFQTYAKALPNNCVFLVDTYDSLQGVKHAVEVGRWLRDNGHELLGIRLDSGDLAYLSREARRILDEGGFPDAVIAASNDLDENVIRSLKEQGATIAVWGVGTRLVTGHDQPALGGVYKLTAIQSETGEWQPRLKLSEQAIKVSTPGRLQVRRFKQGDEYVADAIYDELLPQPTSTWTVVDPVDMTRRKKLTADVPSEDLLVPVFSDGKCVYESPTLPEMQQRCARQLAGFHGGVKRFVNPHAYPVGLERTLHARKIQLILEARGMVE